MKNSNAFLKQSSELEGLINKDDYSVTELETILNLKAHTIEKYCSQFKEVLSSHEKFTQKDIQTLLLIESMKNSGLNLSQITNKICEYHQLLKQTLNGTSHNPIKSLESYPRASGLKRPLFKGSKSDLIL
ncbi:MAG: MerR family transcriptional regulator [Candidatus Cloacimonetes bacterium]|nr:MerR family transcriptional regulator [Candidatus Cloacimonadota bacterium]